MKTKPMEGGRRKAEGGVRRVVRRSARFNASALQRLAAFTLIEMLVVIAVIAILAAMIFPVAGVVKTNRIKKRAMVELAGIQMAIEDYKSKLGFYPPDNPLLPATNQLYYELIGTTLNNGIFQTRDGGAQIANNAAGFQAAFGPGTSLVGFMNCTKGAGGDDAAPSQQFLSNLRAAQFMAVTTPITATVLGTSLEGPFMFQGAGGKINPWRYNSSNATNNPGSFDLWVDVYVGSKTNRICNWSTTPQIPTTIP